MLSSWRMTLYGSVIPFSVTPCGLALPVTACPPNPAATMEGRRSTSPEQDSPCIPRSVTVSKNDIYQKICIIYGGANISKVVMFWDIARGLLCGLMLQLLCTEFLTCHILTSHFGAAMSRWTGRVKMTCHQTSQWSSIPICIGMVLLIKYNENGTNKRTLSKYQFVVTNDTAGCLNSTTCGATIDYKLCIVTTSEFPVDVACWLDVMLRLIHRRRCGKSSGGNQVPWK